MTDFLATVVAKVTMLLIEQIFAHLIRTVFVTRLSRGAAVGL